jgi:signal transduction histidine kinase
MPPWASSRSQRKQLTLSQKVSLGVLLAVASLIGFFLLEGIREQKALLANLAKNQARSMAMLLRASLEDPTLWESPKTLQAFVERLAATRTSALMSQTRSFRPLEELDILVLDSNHTVLAASISGEVGKTFTRDPGNEIRLTMSDGRMREFVEPGEISAFWVLVRVEAGDAKKGVLLLRSPYATVGAQPHTLALELTWEAILIAILSLLLILWMTRRYVLRPISLLREGALAWKRGELTHRVSFPGSDELGELRDAFNEMATILETQHVHLARKQADLEESLRRNQEAQAQLIQSEKLASIGTLAAGVAHELNQPLMLIRGYAQRLLRKENGIGPKAREEIEIIEGETSRMTRIIQQLKDFSRKSTGDYQEVDINSVIQSSFALLSEQLRLHKIEVRLELGHALPRIWGDPIQLTQVFVNIITNARDALHEVGGGTLTVRSRSAHANTVEVLFEDTGPGIPADILPRIFDPFFTTKAVGSGTGLGLSIALGLIQAHGGKIDVESESGRGARFTVALGTGGKTRDGE